MHGFLKGLDIQAEIHLACSDIIADIRQVGRLNAIEEDKERQNFIVSRTLRLAEFCVVFKVLIQIDLFRNPEVIHGLTIPVRYPFILHIIEVVQIGGVAVNHTFFRQFGITVLIEERFALNGLYMTHDDII